MGAGLLGTSTRERLAGVALFAAASPAHSVTREMIPREIKGYGSEEIGRLISAPKLL